MRWSSCGYLVLLIFFTYYSNAKSVDSLHSSHSSHHPSLSIAGDPKDVKLKASIDQLVRALQYVEPKQTEAKKPLIRKRITSADLITKKSRNLYYGESSPGAIPDPITISSQAIQITGANGTGGKRGRSLTSVDASGVKTIEGIRVPDDEHDKHYTWRNARVIKGFLVPNGKSAQPHRKRQIVYGDSSQHYLASLAQQQGSTLIDSNGYQPQAQSQSSQTIIYQTQQPQATHTQYVQQDLGASGATVYTASPAQVQYQSNPGSSTIVTTAQNAEAAAYPQYHQQQGQVYVLQEGTNTYVPYNPVQVSQTHASQSQFSSRTGEATPSAAQTQSQAQVTTVEQQQQQQQQQQLYQQQVQQFQQQQAAAEAAQAQAHAQAQAQAQAQAVQQAHVVQQQQAAAAQAHVVQHQHEQQQAAAAVVAAAAPHQENQRQPPAEQSQPRPQQVQQQAPVQQTVVVHQQQPQQQIAQIQQLHQQQQAAQVAQQLHYQQQQQQQQQQSSVVQLPQGATVIQTRLDQHPQEIAAAATSAQILQLQQQQQPVQTQTVYQIHNPSATSQFSERQSVTYQSNPSNGFVIQPQTYVTGPGGQMFTVPVPIPAEQAHHDQQQQQHHQQQHHSHHHGHQGQQNSRQRIDLGGLNKEKNISENLREKFSFANRLMQSFQFNRKTMETVERNAVVPALASTGLFLGLGALAAGWYLSKNNREVGIVRRSGRPLGTPGGPLIQPNLSSYTPVPTGPTGPTAPAVIPSAPPAVAGTPVTTGRKRSRRSPQNQEVDQATFFQSIIQQSLAKQQQAVEEQRPVYTPPAPPTPQYREVQEFEESHPRPKHTNRHERVHPKYSSSRDDDEYYQQSSPNSKVSKHHYAQDKSGWSLGSAKNFAQVAVPAVILGGAIIGMAALIFGWYISGTNREIAFLEPAAYSRRKRSLMSSTALSDGWLQRILTSIHGNPYENLSHEAFEHKSMLPHPFSDKETSKTSDMEFKISNGGLAGVLAGGAIIAVLALGLASSFSETSRQLNSGVTTNNIFGSSTNNKYSSQSVSSNSQRHLRVPRSILTNELNVGVEENSGFLGSILQNLEVSQSSILNKSQEAGYTKWQETPCAKRIFCDVMSAQSEDTVRLLEKRMATLINLLPQSMSSSLSKTMGDLISSIIRRDCSAYSCGGHWVDPSIVDQPSPPANQPR